MEIKGKILIADDENIQRMILSRKLKFYWYDVIQAVNWKEAVELARDYNTKLLCIIIDNTMPVLNGIDAVVEIRKILGEVNIIMASWDNLDEQYLKSIGINHFLKKPYNMENLKLLINT